MSITALEIYRLDEILRKPKIEQPMECYISEMSFTRHVFEFMPFLIVARSFCPASVDHHLCSFEKNRQVKYD
jgi:hypothetical protein